MRVVGVGALGANPRYAHAFWGYVDDAGSMPCEKCRILTDIHGLKVETKID